MLLFGLLIAAAASAQTDAREWGEWIPDTPGWKQTQDHRYAQIRRIQSSQMRWDAMMTMGVIGMLVPNFTDIGYKVVQQPPGVHRRLNETLWKRHAEGRPIGDRLEGANLQISGGVPQFTGIGNLGNELLKEMKGMHEEWSGVELEPTSAYGLRIYEPGNSLTMHVDKSSTHVISSIVHVGHDTDVPWPIVIEGFDGKTVEVDLQPGEMLFYESSKCLHGRPRPMVGRWYTSLFMHYAPKNWDITAAKARKLCTPIYESQKRAEPIGDDLPEIKMRGTGLYEPSCENEWCSLSPVWPPLPSKAKHLRRETASEDGEEVHGEEL